MRPSRMLVPRASHSISNLLPPYNHRQGTRIMDHILRQRGLRHINMAGTVARDRS